MRKKTITIILSIVLVSFLGVIFFYHDQLGIGDDSLEKIAPLALQEGMAFPSFSLTEVDGGEITLDTIRKKPTIVWFTATWCIPCRIGAKEVIKLDDELGGDAFDVLVVFVDQKEDIRALRQWKKDFANADWIIAFDNPEDAISQRINLKFLDAKYLLDSSGIILDIDMTIAGETYLDRIRNAVATQ